MLLRFNVKCGIFFSHKDCFSFSRFCSSSSPLHISQSDPQVLTETFLSHLCDRIRKVKSFSFNTKLVIIIIGLKIHSCRFL